MIFGLGSGRCGTKSLAVLLNLPHETRVLPWVVDEDMMEAVLDRVHPIGDVAFYWLNYVPLVLKRYSQAKFVCLRRGREDTVRSWMNKALTRDFFGPKDAPEVNQFPLVLGFPEYGDITPKEGWSRWYDEYYEKASMLELEFPDSFRVFDMNFTLTTVGGQQEMLKFCGSNQNISLDLHYNKGLSEMGAPLLPLHPEEEASLRRGGNVLERFGRFLREDRYNRGEIIHE